MKMIAYVWPDLDKTAWGEGPWLREPDKMQWTDLVTGLPCLLVRQPTLGTLCGYVGVPEGHPCHAVDRWDLQHLNAHGAVNYSAFCQPWDNEAVGVCHVGEPDRVWWLGFDCGHAWDVAPSMIALMRKANSFLTPEMQALLESPENPFRAVYRTVEYVMEEVARLASQLAPLALPSP